MNSLIRSSSFLGKSLGFSVHNNMSFANTDSFISSFSICIPFIYFSSLTGMSGTYKTMLIKSGEGGHPLLFLILREMLFFFS